MLLKFLIKTAQGDGIYNLFQKLTVGPNQQLRLLSVVDRPTVGFLTVVLPPGRSRLDPESRALWPVDRPVDPGQFREQSSLDGRPALKPFGRARLCTSVDRHGRLTSVSVDRPVYRQKAMSHILRIKNLVFLPSKKSARWQKERAELPFRSTARSTGQRSFL